MKKVRVSAVKFYNSLPMVYGLKNTSIFKEIELSLDTPAECAQKLIEAEADIGLVPVATIPFIKNASVFSNYCIGAMGKVRTVALMSELPLDKIKKIILDPHSRTSVALMKILAKEYWKKDFEFINGTPGFEKNDVRGETAGVVIGDKVFDVENKFPFVIDLAEIWQIYTNLPFVFACWVSGTELSESFIGRFNQAIEFGLLHLVEVVKTMDENGNLSREQLLHYLKYNIDYNFDTNKKVAMSLFLHKLHQL